MKLWQTNPFQTITLSHGEGCKVWDTTGKSYLDMLSGTWCNALGYGHPRWVEVLQNQVSKLVHTGWPFLSAEIDDGLARLQEILPSTLNRAVFLNTGSEAVELALKMARAATGADGVVVIERGYYGATTYALALSEAGRTSQYLPSVGQVHRLQVPNCRDCPLGCQQPCKETFPCLAPLEELADKGDKSIAAVIYEPVMAGAGNLVPPQGYGARLRALTSRCNAMLISEEVTTGMGRTGRWFGFEHENIVPDILVIGKAIGAGLPVAAVVSSAEVEAQGRDSLVRHVQSHQNDPFSGRIAAAVIAIMKEEKLVERAAENGNYLLAGLKDLQKHCQQIVDVRGKGAMVGIQLHQDWKNNGAEMARRLLETGFIVDYHALSSTFRLFPPYIISHQEIDDFLQAFKQKFCGGPGGGFSKEPPGRR